MTLRNFDLGLSFYSEKYLEIFKKKLCVSLNYYEKLNYVFPNFQPTFKLLKVVEFNSSNASVCEQNEIYLHIFRSYGHRLKFLSSTLAPHVHEAQE